MLHTLGRAISMAQLRPPQRCIIPRTWQILIAGLLLVHLCIALAYGFRILVWMQA